MATTESEPPASPLWTLGYLSVAPTLPLHADLEHILAASRRANPEHGVTGLLVHCEGTFMQVLEGPRAGVDEIFRRIRANALHTNINVLFDERIEQREFGNWSMACKELSRDQLQPVLAAPLASKRMLLAEYWLAWQ
jgi:hypothetical protein